MKALIFNSGTGSRMGTLTKNCPKCLLKLTEGESVLSRQLRILSEWGITDFVITTGKYTQEIERECFAHSGINFTLVNNPLYTTTNYIYSMYLAEKYLDDDILLFHGDLVFDKALPKKILSDNRPSLCLINENSPLPKKDFKGRISNGILKEVSVNIFDRDCYALQPLYKLSRECIGLWLDEVNSFVKMGITDVYAENALNNISHKLQIQPMSYEGHFISEIDTVEDYEMVCKDIALM